MYRLDAPYPWPCGRCISQINGFPQTERAAVGTPGPWRAVADERGSFRAVIAKQSHDLSFRYVQIGVPQRRRYRAERFSYPLATEQHSINVSILISDALRIMGVPPRSRWKTSLDLPAMRQAFHRKPSDLEPL